MGRTKIDREARPPAVQTRLDDEDQVLWERLVEVRLEELRVEGVKASASDVLRWLIRKEALARGLDKPAKKGSAK